ncbi:MAG: glycosyltransferase [Blautia sp.]|nr:glycosyltransferase [Blautia sp.]
MRYSIIVALDNNFALTNNFIENLLLTTDFEDDGELIIVSDGCNDIHTIEYLKDLSNNFSSITVIYNNIKQGYGKSNNIAADASSGNILVFINSDVFPVHGSIHSLVSYLEKNISIVGAVQGLLIYPQNNKVQSTGHLFMDLQNEHVYQDCDVKKDIIKKEGCRQALTSAFCAIPRNVFIKNGKFNEHYYNAYEGFELTLKINLSGVKCMYYPEAIAYHIGGGTRNSMDICEVQQGKYFIQNWGNKIMTDIEQYIIPQLSKDIQKRMYSTIVLSQLTGWETIIKVLELNINGYIYHPCSGEINLYQLFPYSFLDFGGNYLFIVDSIKYISKNYNWIKNRKNSYDIAIDSHGNVIALQEFLS